MTPARLLIVDDQAPIRYALREFFAATGWHVDCAGSFDEAVAALAAHDYAGVISDLRLDARCPASGLEVVRTARAKSAAVSIVVLTAYGTPETIAAALRDGADAWLDKPVALAEVARILDRARRARSAG